ncbi:MAG: hypothetical protein U1F43_02175 [Myxococcota bacterium]
MAQLPPLVARLVPLSLPAALALACALAAPAAAAPMDGIPDPKVVDAICGSRFGGDFASVIVYRADEGEVSGYELRPDLTRVSHPPSTIYDARGNEILVIPEHPVVPGSDEALAIQKKRAAATRDSKPAETLACAAPPRAIHELIGRPAARAVVEGVVVRRYACPPCPPGAECKPCLPDHFVLSERADLPRDAALGDSEVVIFGWGGLPPVTVGQRVRVRVVGTQIRQTFDNRVPDQHFLGFAPAR